MEQMATLITEARAAGKAIVVAGCVPQGSKNARELEARCPRATRLCAPPRSR